MSDNLERDAIERNIKNAREGIGRELDDLDIRLSAMKENAASKVPALAAGVLAVGLVLAFAPAGIRAIFRKVRPRRRPKRKPASEPQKRSQGQQANAGQKTTGRSEKS
ncbi:MAG TPA: hypothetical protein VNM92_04095 [Thermoanaerobaculia bacterium]|nr:hypothetical protein [Thermoanaerobaculia bacterium]